VAVAAAVKATRTEAIAAAVPQQRKGLSLEFGEDQGSEARGCSGQRDSRMEREAVVEGAEEPAGENQALPQSKRYLVVLSRKRGHPGRGLLERGSQPRKARRPTKESREWLCNLAVVLRGPLFEPLNSLGRLSVDHSKRVK
jgi:hypothetical protein